MRAGEKQAREQALKRHKLARERTLDAIKKEETARHAPKKTNWTKIALWGSAIILALILWQLFDVPQLILSLLEQNPHLWALYQAIASEIEARTLLGLFYASLFGSLFFLSIPIEVIFLYYLGLNYYVVQIFTIVMIGNMLGMLFNYGVGRLIGDKPLKKVMKNYERFRKKLERAGGFLILIGNIIPFPIEPFSVFLGAVKYRFWWFVTYTIIGKVIKFLILIFGYTYFVKYAAPYLDTVSVDWFVESIRKIFVFW